MSEKKQLTTSAGAPVADNQNSMTAGPRGPVLLQDYQLIEKLAHQNRERIPERPVHAKGWGAHGALTITNDITRYSKAGLFSEVGKQTPMIARFSTVAGELGAADAERDVRGFALKFYTEEGNWDMVGNNTPVFFRARPLQVSGLHPHAEAPPQDQPAFARRDVGLLVAVAGESAPGDDPDVRPRPACERPPRQRLRLPHLLPDQQRGRAFLGQVPLQDAAGPQALDERRGRQGRRPHARVDPGGSVRRDRERRLSQVAFLYPGHARNGCREDALQPVRSDQGVAARRLPADRGRHP